MQRLDALENLNRLVLPDGWQVEAVTHLRQGLDVIVDAPTGAGKTYVFEKHWEARGAQCGAVYTVPTRALANDKYAEWKSKGWRVGITTGDVTVDADAPLLVATLEAVQQVPVRRPDVGLFVVDEYQWLSDPMRGSHYEGVILSLPRRIQLLLLSGSVANPRDIAAWFRRLGRAPVVVSHPQRPVPLEEVDVDDLARGAGRVEGFWAKRVFAALRENLGPVLIFCPHRAEAEKMARKLSQELPPPQKAPDLKLEEEALLGPALAKLVKAGIAYHHSGLDYAQRARVIEPLAKAGRLRVVVATLGLSAGINFSLRSVLITARHYRHEGYERDILPHELLQMIGRAGRRGLDDCGYYLSTRQAPSLHEARALVCRRAAPLPWSALLQKVGPGEEITGAAAEFSRSLFHDQPLPMGNEATEGLDWRSLPCRIPTDTGRARLVRRKRKPFKACRQCSHRPECLKLPGEPRLLWQWGRVGILDRQLKLTPRGNLVSLFMGAEGLALAAALESGDYPPEEILFDCVNLFANDRFAGSEPRWAGKLAAVCQKVYGNFSIEGYLQHGVPPQYGLGGREVVEKVLDGHRKARLAGDTAGVGDIERLLIEWRSFLRQIVHAPEMPSYPGWEPLRAEARRLLHRLEMP